MMHAERYRWAQQARGLEPQPSPISPSTRSARSRLSIVSAASALASTLPGKATLPDLSVGSKRVVASRILLP